MDPEQKLTETRDEPQSNIEDDIKDTSILSDQNDEQNTKEDDNIGNGDAINGNTVDEEARSNEQMGYSQEELPQVIPTESNAKIPTDETQDHGPPDGIGGGGGSTSEDQIKTGMKKGKRSKKHEDGLHRVTLTVTIAKAIPSSEDDGPKVDELMKRKKRIVEAPKANGYYHCQYYLLPDDEDPTKTDVVTFGMAAKIYTETDSKVLKTWQEGDQTWIAWSHSHTLKVTKELLLKLFDHTLELRIWESRDKVSARARFDRPKAFRLPQPKPGEDVDDVGGVKSLVLKQSKSYLSLQPKKSFSERPVPQNAPPELSDISNFGKTDSKGRPVLPRAVSSSPEQGFKTPEELLRLTDLNRSALNPVHLQPDRLQSLGIEISIKITDKGCGTTN
ncbi:hypothetical protein BSL78_07839 [Apostichopus japonicus]|uniref:DUF4550 domain-containing protein n=1 Tax=Stichopus japonicus TaxID=307972 RepID=A0A2G8L4P9_STIJA|nr:hypothetical protein BSL78_07839 [Apostichopus japonicus]